jgi:hypothetical protein
VGQFRLPQNLGGPNVTAAVGHAALPNSKFPGIIRIPATNKDDKPVAEAETKLVTVISVEQ